MLRARRPGFHGRMEPWEHTRCGRTFHQSFILRQCQLIPLGLDLVIGDEYGKVPRGGVEHIEHQIIHPGEKPVSIINVENHVGIVQPFVITDEFIGKTLLCCKDCGRVFSQ